MIFETFEDTLSRYPHTLLGDPEARARYFDPHRRQYFFDRHRESFEAILFFYQSRGFIQRPVAVPLHLFIEEVRFFRLGEAAMRFLRRDEGLKSTDDILLPEGTLKRKIWLLVEYPLSSTFAKWISIFSMTMILISVACFCLETLPCFITYSVDLTNLKPTFVKDDIFYTPQFFYVEFVCMVWFTLEIIVRFTACPSKIEYFKSVMNIVDILAVIPFYAAIIALYLDASAASSTYYARFLRFLRLVRVIRVLKLSRHSKGLQVLGKTILTSCRELVLLLFCLIVCIVLFATMVYYAEMDSHTNNFASIPDSFWWAVVTMTTVGYGDMHPETTMGKLVGCVCAVAGVLAIALPVPVIVSNFNYFYTKERENHEILKHTVNERFHNHKDNQRTGALPQTCDELSLNAEDSKNDYDAEANPDSGPHNSGAFPKPGGIFARPLNRFRRNNRHAPTTGNLKFDQ